MQLKKLWSVQKEGGRERGYEINTSLKAMNMGKVWNGKSHTRTILVDFPAVFMIQVNS